MTSLGFGLKKWAQILPLTLSFLLNPKHQLYHLDQAQEDLQREPDQSQNGTPFRWLNLSKILDFMGKNIVSRVDNCLFDHMPQFNATTNSIYSLLDLKKLANITKEKSRFSDFRKNVPSDKCQYCYFCPLCDMPNQKANCIRTWILKKNAIFVAMNCVCLCWILLDFVFLGEKSSERNI